MGSVEVSKPHHDVKRAVAYQQKHLAGNEQINLDRALLDVISAIEEGRIAEAAAGIGTVAGVGTVGGSTPSETPNITRKRYYEQEGKTLGWHGKLAEHYGLIGKPVEDKTFERLLSGQDPEGVQHIRKYADSDPFSDSAWKGRLGYTANVALKRNKDSGETAAPILREVPAGAKRPIRKPAEARNRSTADWDEIGTLLEVGGERIERLKKMHAIAAEHYQAKLADPSGQAVRDYMDGRKISENVRSHFGLGASDSSNDLAVKLCKEFTAAELRESGLLFERNGRWHDRFKNRLMVPIKDAEGDVVAFASRKISEEDAGGKWENSRSTLIYQKKNILYNYAEAKAAQTGRMVPVEGYPDLWAAWEAGITDVVAPCGTEFSQEHFDLMAAAGSDVVLALNSGKALNKKTGSIEPEIGQQKTENYIPKLLKAGLRVRAVDLEPEHAGKIDCFDYAAKYGPDALRARINNVGPVVEWLAARANVKFATSKRVDEKKALAWIRATLAPAANDLRPELMKEVEWYLQVAPRPDRKDIAGWDLKVSTPKSYSLAAIAGGDTRLLEGIQEVMLETLDKAEFGAVGQIGKGKPKEHTGKWVSAVFHHLTARPVEGSAPNPHNHYHCFFMNQTLCEDGEIRSLDPDDIFKRQKYLDARFQCGIASVARRCGYDPKPHGRGEWSELAGYSPELLKAMSLRSEEIEAAKKEQDVEGAEWDDIIGKRLRRKKEDWAPEALMKAWYETAWSLGKGDDYDAVRKQAEARGFHGWDKDRRAVVADQAIDWAITAGMEHQTVLSDYEILAKAFQYRLDGYLGPNDIESAYERRLMKNYGENGGMVRVQHYRQGKPGERYTTTAMQRDEEACVMAAVRGLDTMQPLTKLTQDELRAMREVIMSNGEKKPLNDKQMYAVQDIVRGTHQYALFNGVAGGGKTSLLKLVKTIIESHSEQEFEIVGLAPTTNATHNLAEVGINCSTFEGFVHREHEPETDPPRYYIGDELSLLAIPEFLAFTKIVRHGIDRVIFIGDKDQHQAVGPGGVFRQMQDCGIPTIYLDKIVRQDPNPKLKEAIECIHASFKGSVEEGKKKLLAAMGILDRDLNAIEDSGRKRTRIEKMVDFYLVDPERALLIAPDNATRRMINDSVQEALFAAGTLDRNTRVELPMMANVKLMRKADLRRATRYEVGDVIRWGKSTTLGGRMGSVFGHNSRIECGEYTEVIGIDPSNNRLKIRTRLGEVEYAATAAQGDVYRAELRAFAVGDRVRVTRPWWAEDAGGKLHKVPNGAIGVIRELNAEGVGVLEFEKGLRVNWNAQDFPHLSLGYATTSYSSQSLTFDRVAIHIETGNSKIRALIDKTLAYVGFSRAARELMIVTDDKEFLCGEQSPLLKHFLKPTANSPQWAEEVAEAVARHRRYRQVNQQNSAPSPKQQQNQQPKVHEGVLKNVNDQPSAGRSSFRL